MMKTDKLIQKILQGRSDISTGFEKLRSLLKSLGLKERIHGSHHHIYHRSCINFTFAK
jgi:hypothetical protein